MTDPIRFVINGRKTAMLAPANRTLADMLREDLHLKGCKVGCDQSVCGACTVLVDGEPLSACSTMAFEVDGTSVVTIEGVRDGDMLSLVQRAFLETSGFQCGYCTPGMVMLATGLLQVNPEPDDAEIRSWMGANICRCTGYGAIVDAVKRAVESTRAAVMSEEHA
ncbi:(2Fe-2S)-binding protein [soil metagenome]